MLIDVTKEEFSASDASLVVSANERGTIFHISSDVFGLELGFDLQMFDNCLQVGHELLKW